MTAAVVRLCACGHPERAHNAEIGCPRGECGCTAFRAGDVQPVETAVAASPPSRGPVAVSTPPESPRGAAPAARPADDSLALLAKAKLSDSRRTVRLAERIEQELEGLAAALRSESAQVQLRREIAELEVALAAKRARLHGQPGGEIPCPEPNCDRWFRNNVAVGIHRSKAHGYRGQS